MPEKTWNAASGRKAYIITGPTSGIGYATALELAKQKAVVLVARDSAKLEGVRATVTENGGHAATVVCDMSDIADVRRAAADIIALNLPIAGLLNNAGIHEARPSKSAQGWDKTFATNHLGPFALAEALLPHLPDGANILFVASGVEDPDRKPAKAAGFRGGRYSSAAESARGEWMPGGSRMAGSDAYATSKQAVLAAALELARENPRLHINAVEPGFIPATLLGRDANVFVRFLLKYILPLFAPHVRYWSTPTRAARMITKILTDPGRTGTYFDDGGEPMLASERVRDPAFQSCVVTDTRRLLATVRA